VSRAEPSSNRPTPAAHRLGDPARRYESAREAIEAKVRVGEGPVKRSQTRGELEAPGLRRPPVYVNHQPMKRF